MWPTGSALPPFTTSTRRSPVLHTIFNEEVADNLVGNTVDTILNIGQADAISVGLTISLWAGSSAMSAFIEAITTAYCQQRCATRSSSGCSPWASTSSR